MIKQISEHSKLQHADVLAAYLPGGDLFVSKKIQGNVFRDMLTGLACEFVRAESSLKDLEQQFIPDATLLFITEWERLLSIPDSCFSGTGSLDKRRRDILAKLASLGVQTEQDFIDLALIFGEVVNIKSGTESNQVFPYTFPLTFPLTAIEARFTIVVEFTTDEAFPYTFPFPLGSDSIAILDCLFNKLKPANCQVLFVAI